MLVKRTLQEIADFFGCWAMVDGFGNAVISTKKPTIPPSGKGWTYCKMRWQEIRLMGSFCVDYDGDWKESLTMPSDPPFRKGEIFICIAEDSAFQFAYYDENGEIADFGGLKFTTDEVRRPTKEEACKLLPYMFEDGE